MGLAGKHLGSSWHGGQPLASGHGCSPAHLQQMKGKIDEMQLEYLLDERSGNSPHCRELWHSSQGPRSSPRARADTSEEEPAASACWETETSSAWLEPGPELWGLSLSPRSTVAHCSTCACVHGLHTLQGWGGQPAVSVLLAPGPQFLPHSALFSCSS